MRGLILGVFWLALLCASAHVLASVPSLSRLAGFQPNVGQMDSRVAYWAEHDGVSLFVTRKGELVHRFQGKDGRDWVLVERMNGPIACFQWKSGGTTQRARHPIG